MDTSPTEIEQYQISADNLAANVEEFFDYHTSHSWDVTVQGYAFAASCRPQPSYWCTQDAQQYLRDTGQRQPDYIQTWAPGHYNWSVSGVGQVGGPHSVLLTTASNHTTRISVHEFGHNLGLWHSSTLTDDGVHTEYGDHTSVMGNGFSFNAPNLIELNLDTSSPQATAFDNFSLVPDTISIDDKVYDIPAESTLYIRHNQGKVTSNEYLTNAPKESPMVVVDSSQQVFLAPLELRDVDLRSEEDRFVVIDVPNNNALFTVSTRKVGPGGGNIEPTLMLHEPGVYIHRTPNRSNSTTLGRYPLKVGESKQIGTGVVVQYLEQQGETARVNVVYDEVVPENTQMSTGFPAVPFGGSLAAEHSGLWYSPEFRGQGFTVFVKGNRALVSWLTFQNGSDRHQYYLSYGSINEVIEGVELWTTDGGTFADPSTREVISAGRSRLYFTEDGGVFNYDMDEYKRGSVLLTQLLQSNDTLNGLWFDPERVGEGFSVIMYGDTMVAYWETYGYNPPTSPFDAAEPDAQKWYYSQGELNAQGTYNLTVREVSGGRFLRFDDVDLTNLGTINVTPNADGTLTADYNFSGNVGTLNLKRLF